MSFSSVAELVPTAQDALRAFLSTIAGKDAPLTIDSPVETTFQQAGDQTLAYVSIVADGSGLRYAVMIDEGWLKLLSKAMLGEELSLADAGAADLIRELAGQAHGAVRNVLDTTGISLPDVSFTVLSPGNAVPADTLPGPLLEVTFGLKIEDQSLGGFALIPQSLPGVQAKASQSGQNQAAPGNSMNAMANNVNTVDVAPISFPDLGSEMLRGDGGTSNLGLLAEVELEITVELGRRRLPLADLLRLTTGSVVELEKLVGEPLEVYANGRLIAEGEAVVIDEQFGIRVTTLASTKQRASTFL
jgi:flagellar motor switch protein FliN